MIERLISAADLIGQRGGEVIFVALPVCGERARIEEERYPRADYWDRFVASSSHRTIHVDDEPSLTEPECYDGSHMDIADARVFTRDLYDIVTERQ